MASSEPTSKKKGSLRPPDPGYEFAFLPDEAQKTKVGCKFCGKVFNGGITRLKEHVAGIAGNVQPCQGVPEEAKLKCLALLNDMKRKKEAGAEALSQQRSLVDLGCSEAEQSDDESEGMPSAKGFGTKDVRAGPMDKFCRLSIEERVKLNKVQPVINPKLKEERRQRACEYIAQFVYEGTIPHNVVKLPSFSLMLEAIGEYGRGLKGPTPYELSGPLLQKRKKKIEESLKPHRESWAVTGCSILTDSWTDKKGRGIMNLVVHSAQGACFLRSVDASADKKDGKYIFQLVDKCIEELGEQNVVQIVADNARPNEAAASLLKVERPNIFWTPCAAHCIDLILEDIGSLSKVKTTIEKAKAVTVFLYAHTRGLELMRRLLGKDLVRSGVTRFATAYLNLKSLEDNKAELKSVFRSEEFENMGYLRTKKGKRAFNVIVTDDNFWKGVSYAVKVFEPLVEVLRLVDSDVPAMGLLWGALDNAKKEIAARFGENERLYSPVLDIIDRRWDAKLKTPLHKAAHYLHPYYYYNNRVAIDSDAGFRGAVILCIGKMCTEAEQDKVGEELDIFEQRFGSFGSAMAVRQSQKIRDPATWWANHGTDVPHLRKLAMRILNLTCSSSACERNWSYFEQVNSKKRAKMLHSRLSDLVFVKFNSKLQQKRETRDRDPIEVQNVDVLYDQDNEWIDDPSSESEESSAEAIHSTSERDEEDDLEEICETTTSSTGKRTRISLIHCPRQRHAKKQKRINKTGELVSCSEDQQEDIPSSSSSE